MRIVYHHRTRGRDVEGVHIRGIVGALRHLGHEVTIVSFPGADPEQAEAAAPRVRAKSALSTLVSKTPGVLFELLELGYNLVTWFRIGRVVRRARPDLIYERYSLFLFATILKARRHGIPIVLEINDSALVPRVRPLFLKALARRIERWCMQNCTGLVFISSYFRDLAREAYGTISPSVVSPNAADAARFDPALFDREALRRRHGIGREVVCGYVGAFVHWHGVAEFVRRMAPRLAQRHDLKLVFVGGGVDLDAVRATVEEHGVADRVLLPGRVDHADIPAWIACMDLAVLPNSNVYGSPMKLFEFMAMGVGVVAPDYSPIAEVVEDGRTGWLFPRGDIEACVDRVLTVAGSPAEQVAVGRAAREYIVRERQWRTNAEQLLSLLPRDAIASAPARSPAA
jgi:glycosyltransferase involved in cell wall biosynthesis